MLLPTLIERMKVMLEEEKKRRLEFYNEITEQEKAEFINGEVIIHSPVRKIHNEVTGNLLKIVETYVIEHDLGFVGFEEILIQCTRNDYEPDLCFFAKEIANRFTEDQSLFPVPNMIVEVLSEGTTGRDRGIKYQDYQSHSVQEYWIVAPDQKVVEQYLLQPDGQYYLAIKTNTGEITCQVIEGLTIPVVALFDKAANHAFVKQLYQQPTHLNTHLGCGLDMDCIGLGL